MITKNVGIFFKSTEYNDQMALKSKQQLKQYVKSHKNWKWVGTYSEYVKENKNRNRKTFSTVIEDVLKKNIDLLVIDNVFSLFDKNIMLKELLEFFDKNHVELYFYKENYSTSCKTVDSQLERLNYEKEKKYLNRTWLKKDKIKEGSLIPAVSFFGYHYDKQTKKYTIVEKEAEVVRLIYKLFLEGMSTYSITRELNNRKCVTLGNNKNWLPGLVSRILTNEKYAGHILYGKDKVKDNYLLQISASEEYGGNLYLLKNHHEALIDQETFDKVQEKYKKLYIEHQKKLEFYKTIFSQKLFCGYCKNTAHIFHDKKSVPKTFCYSSKKMCKSKSIYESILKDTFVECYNKLIEDKEKYGKILTEKNLIYVNSLIQNGETLECFNDKKFDEMIKYLIIGKKTKRKFEPYVIRFVLKNNLDSFLKREKDFSISNQTYDEILSYDSRQIYFNFEFIDGKRTSFVKDNVKVILCCESGK